VQHLDERVVDVAETGWPIWGSVSAVWASPEMQKRGEVAVQLIVPGRLAKSGGYPVVNPAGRTIHGPVDHVSLSAGGTTVNLSEMVRTSMRFGARFRAALARAKERELTQRNGRQGIVLDIVFEPPNADQLAG
jgi:hypothetical protein